ncbi:hypothetical protein BsWGS_08851 [Bradybaena similaris]
MDSSGGDDCSSQKKKKVLCVGNVCLDLINVAQEYPQEDSDQKGLEHYWQRGGNATNNCTVLSILSVPCEFMGVLGNQGAEARWIQDDYDKFGIKTTNCVTKPVQNSVATAIISQVTGSRTILYYPRDRPELTYNEFHENFHGDFTPYSWVHFELGRSVDETSHMIDDVVAFNNVHNLPRAPDSQRQRVIISVEYEKPELKNPESEMGKADIVFLSKDVAKFRGYSNAVLAVEGLQHLCKDGAVLVCAWGDAGAAARYRDQTLTAPALTDIKVVDTLGAGDTFIAGFISRLWKNGWACADCVGRDTESSIIANAIQYACVLAGLKCTMFGYQGLKQHLSSIV